MESPVADWIVDWLCTAGSPSLALEHSGVLAPMETWPLCVVLAGRRAADAGEAGAHTPRLEEAG